MGKCAVDDPERHRAIEESRRFLRDSEPAESRLDANTNISCEHQPVIRSESLPAPPRLKQQDSEEHRRCRPDAELRNHVSVKVKRSSHCVRKPRDYEGHDESPTVSPNPRTENAGENAHQDGSEPMTVLEQDMMILPPPSRVHFTVNRRPRCYSHARAKRGDQSAQEDQREGENHRKLREARKPGIDRGDG